ncbi:NAD(P)H-dependent oxidoreductase [Wenyingzhuangia sp. 2_MG-2023]|uniref:NAD(P)H-dependent oxidoreductase n=1 Tax=Wenyingzhuangia sp. 2_MG-2023 TaxID=3062639 RepID=UPI0026E205A9|nr:NAD(P)H-dependent oxidoreductase [Wenyingzhuangia sp. 2_MG-2023]MDO6737848.1 NAD(P)H-dependent oxidoreductase [Wenyingzhuangia sp. 2_MG-2023]
MNIIESLQWRYATKKFDPNKKISSTQLQTLKEAFNLTATSYGLQALNLVIVKNTDLREQLLEASFNQKQVIDASHLLVICYPINFDSNNVNEYFELVQQIRNTPEEVLKPFKDFLIHEFETKSTVDKNIYFTKQAYIALGNLLTTCAVEKIDACPMEGFIPSKYDEILGLTEKGLTSVLVLPVGFRAEDDFMAKEKKVRKPLSKTIIEL